MSTPSTRDSSRTDIRSSFGRFRPLLPGLPRLPGMPGLPKFPVAPWSTESYTAEHTVSATVEVADIPEGYAGFVYGELVVGGDVIREESATVDSKERVTFEFTYDAEEYDEPPSRVSVLTSTELEYLGSGES